MKTKLLILFVILLLNPIFNYGQNINKESCNADSKIINIPEGNCNQVNSDGIFSKGEWDDALYYPVADNYNIYLKADSEILCIGLKSAEPIIQFLCEIRITSDENEVFLLHVSGSLAEGVSGFPSTTKFEVNNNKYWESNYCKADSAKKAVWIEAGKPIEKSDEMYERKDGIEFKIYRKKFTDNSLKFTMGWLQVEIKGNQVDKKIFNYPVNATLKNADNWVELILP